MLYKKFIVGFICVSGASLALSLLPGSTVTYTVTEAAPTVDAPIQNPELDTSLLPTTTIQVADTTRETPSEESEKKPARREEVTEVTSDNIDAELDDSIESVSTFDVPFFSQFSDITAQKWKGVGCGIASLAMLIEFYKPGVVDVDTLLDEGISGGAYLNNAGWTYAGLIGVSKKYGLRGESHDLAGSSMQTAFEKLEEALEEGPVMVSVHYTFDPKNPIPHLVIANGVSDGMVYYNDPAEKSGGGSVSITQFKSAWKKRYIEFYPVS